MEDVKTTSELHVCMGLNACKNQGYSSNNDCAGMGDCSTVNHPCHTLNECKGQGGCGLFGTTVEFCFPSQNECRYQGSCGAPILNSRFVTQGPNKGRSVWQLARKRFEEKRSASNQSFGVPPGGPYGPTNAYVNKLRNGGNLVYQDYASCGQSGDRHCSYAADPVQRAEEADDRVLVMAQDSAAEMKQTLKTCPPIDY